MEENYWNRRGNRAKAGYMGWLRSDESEKAIYRSTFNLQTHIDVREIALLDMFLRKLGHAPRTLSELAKMTIQLVTNVALEEGSLPLPQTAEDALIHLDAHGYSLGQFSTRGRQQSRINTALQRESLREARDTSDDDFFKRPPDDKYDLWAKTRWPQIQAEEGILIGYAKMEADREAEILRQAGVEPDTDHELLVAYRRRKKEEAEAKKAVINLDAIKKGALDE